jgi:signal transduction histidine kinase
MNGVIQEVTALLQGEIAAKGISLHLDLAPELPAVSGDRIQLQQVIMNLLLNGIEAMSAPACNTRKLVVQTVKDDRGAIRVAVRDTGVGLDEENLDRIFKAFFTTKAEGLGMGLSIVRSIVEAHGGRLWARNNPDVGATFLFTLPASDQSEK